MALSSLKCNGTISFVYVKSGGRIMQISGRSDSLCIFLYEMDFSQQSEYKASVRIPPNLWFIALRSKIIKYLQCLGFWWAKARVDVFFVLVDFYLWHVHHPSVQSSCFLSCLRVKYKSAFGLLPAPSRNCHFLRSHVSSDSPIIFANQARNCTALNWLKLSDRLVNAFLSILNGRGQSVSQMLRMSQKTH